MNLKLLFFLLIFCGIFGLSAKAMAATYYVSTTGNDSNVGTSEGAAWKTIAKVNSSTFQPEDQILFKRGESWTQTLIPPKSGTEGHPITFGAYGTGADPIIDGTGKDYCISGATSYITINGLHLKDANVAGIYHNHWNPYGVEQSTPGWIVENCTFTHCGVELFGPNTIIQDNTFIGPQPTSGAPMGAVFIRGAVAENCVAQRNNISGFYGRGIWFMQGAKNPTANDNIIHDIAFHPGTPNEGYCINFDGYGQIITGTVTATGNTVYNCASNGIEMENCSDGSLIHGNLVHDCARSGIIYMNYPAFSGHYADQRGNDVGGVVTYNIVYNCNRGIILEDVAHVDIWNNVLYNGTGSYPKAVGCETTSSYVNNIDFRNNIANTGWSQVASVPHEAGTWKAFFSAFDYNQVQADVIEERGAHQINLDTLKKGGDMLNSFSTDPAFENAAGHNFHIGSASPCKDKGFNIGLTKDFDGISVPQGPAPDVGAYEYQSGGDTSPPAAPANLRIIKTN